MNMSIDNRYCNRFIHIRRPIFSVNRSNASVYNLCLQSTTKPCAYFLGYNVCHDRSQSQSRHQDVVFIYDISKVENTILVKTKRKFQNTQFVLWCSLLEIFTATFQDKWFVIEFPDNLKDENIAFLEFYPIVVPIQVFGRKWQINVYILLQLQSCGSGYW